MPTPPVPPVEDCLSQENCPALAWHRQRLAELAQQAASDSLTGLWNRAHFDRMLDSELDRSRRYRQPVALILFDVDHFKRINDLHGHQAGDAVLRELALVAHSALRAPDALFRWGGEEFVILAPSTGHRGAQRLAQSLCLRVADATFPAIGKLTVSAGVAEHLDAESGNDWFQRADAMLYRAKSEGRNRICTDARGNSDRWAERNGTSALHLVWQEAYECGEPTIDGEHRRLFDLANALIDAFLSGKDESTAIVPAYERLLEHIARHFADEEAILARHGFAGLERHRCAHAGLLARAHALRSEVAAGSAGLGRLIEFLAADVVARHLFKTDSDFYTLFAGDGPSRASIPSG